MDMYELTSLYTSTQDTFSVQNMYIVQSTLHSTKDETGPLIILKRHFTII